MRTVALEEHFSVPSLSQRIAKDIISRRGYRPRNLTPGAPNPLELLPEIGEIRLKSMDETGITVQVLSNSGPGRRSGARPRWRRAGARDQRSSRGGHRAPSRPLRRLCRLPLQSPDARAVELERAVKELGFVGAMVNGTTEGRFLDHPSYDGLLAAAVELDVPIYIHPHIPPEPVRQAYFSDLPEGATACSRPPAGAGIRKPPCIFCAWWSPARSIVIRG